PLAGVLSVIPTGSPTRPLLSWGSLGVFLTSQLDLSYTPTKVAVAPLAIWRIQPTVLIHRRLHLPCASALLGSVSLCYALLCYRPVLPRSVTYRWSLFLSAYISPSPSVSAATASSRLLNQRRGDKNPADSKGTVIMISEEREGAGKRNTVPRFIPVPLPVKTLGCDCPSADSQSFRCGYFCSPSAEPTPSPLPSAPPALAPHRADHQAITRELGNREEIQSLKGLNTGRGSLLVASRGARCTPC
ncbi:unnamed protein product, partial [Pleuronectes platessa]